MQKWILGYKKAEVQEDDKSTTLETSYMRPELLFRMQTPFMLGIDIEFPVAKALSKDVFVIESSLPEKRRIEITIDGINLVVGNLRDALCFSISNPESRMIGTVFVRVDSVAVRDDGKIELTSLS